jgi:tRNA G46 methylase TrmB
MRMVLAMLACPATWALALRPARRLARASRCRASAAGTRLDDASPYAIDERPVDVEAVGALAARHVARHGDWLAAKPVARHTAAAFDAFLAAAAGRSEIVVDAGCGTGVSTAALAARHPDALVVGVDRSADRLGRGRAPLPDNAFLLRAELADFWRLCAAADVAVAETYLLYPNPYPKPGHLKKRFHGHPCLPSLLAAAGGRLTLRASWRTYLDEFLAATRAAAAAGDGAAARLLAAGASGPAALAAPRPADALTAFEAKYAAAGQPTFELVLGRRAR